MSNGYEPRFGLTLQDEDIEKLNLESYKEFKSLLNNYEVDLNDYAHSIIFNGDIIFGFSDFDPDEENEIIYKRERDLLKLYTDFTIEFREETSLYIGIEYHDSKEYGNENDDVDGHFYNLSFAEIYEPTEDAKLLCNTIPIDTEGRYVSFGSSVYVIHVDKEGLKKLNLESYKNFINKLNEYEVDLDNFAKDYSGIERMWIEDDILSKKDGLSEDDDEIVDNIRNELFELFDNFCEEFKGKTKLCINIAHHNCEDDGDCYDTIDGHYFYLNFSEFYEKTKEAKRLEEKVEFKTSYYVFCH